MSKSYFVLLSLIDVLVIFHMASVNEMMCPWDVSAWSQMKTGGRGIEAYTWRYIIYNFIQ